jgi:DNA polymerase III psi subunit
MKPSTLDETMSESFSMLFSIFEHHFPEEVDVAGIKKAFVKTLQGQYPSTGDERIRTVDVATSYINSVCPFLRAVLHSFYLSDYIPMMYWLELRFLGHLTFSQYMWLHVLFLSYGERIWSAALVTLLYQRIRAIISKHTYIHKELTSGELLQKICTPSDAYPNDFDGSLLLSVVRAMRRE